jgi:hypothetical protein
VHILTGGKLKLISLVALANRNAKAGKKPTLALIETTAHAKRCGFGLSIQKFDPEARAPIGQIRLNWPGLLDFLNAGDEFRGLFSVFSRDSGGGESQNYYYFPGREHVNAPLNCGPINLAGPAFAEMRHAIMRV